MPDTEVATSSERFFAWLAGCALLLAAGIILSLVASVIVSVWRGDFGARPSPIRSAPSDRRRVILTGTVAPAWTWLRSPLGGVACVYYSSRAYTAWRFLRPSSIDERNALPFVLDDGGDRVLVLARRARWETEEKRPRPGEDDISPRLPERSMEPLPCLKSRRERYDDGLARSNQARESVVRIGDVVTVAGALVEFDSTTAEARIGCLDDGRSLRLPATVVLAPVGRRGLLVTPGDPSQIRREAWLGLARCIVGVPLVAAAGVAVFLLLMPFTAIGK